MTTWALEAKARLERLQILYDAWLAHAQEAHHDLETAKYDRNLASTYIECCVRGCKWTHEVRP